MAVVREADVHIVLMRLRMDWLEILARMARSEERKAAIKQELEYISRLRDELIDINLPDVADGAEIRKLEIQERAFWFRRLVTTLSIGNAAGILAIGSTIGQAGKAEDIAPYLSGAFNYFAMGLICSGVLPLGLALWPRWSFARRPSGHSMGVIEMGATMLPAVFAIIFFTSGLMQVSGYVNGLK